MKLYHGNLVTVETPQILKREKGKTCDFGFGFYTTTSYKQAERWVKIKSGVRFVNGFVSEYSVPNDLLKKSELKTLLFDSVSEAWLDFVIKNRTQKNFTHDYDIVFGPVANDRVYTTITLYESQLIDKRATMQQLMAYKLVDQCLFHTEKALQYVTFVKSTEVV